MRGMEIASMIFWLILGFLIINNASAMNSLISTGGGFLTGAFGVLQGRALTGSISSPSYGTSSTGLFGGSRTN